MCCYTAQMAGIGHLSYAHLLKLCWILFTEHLMVSSVWLRKIGSHSVTCLANAVVTIPFKISPIVHPYLCNFWTVFISCGTKCLHSLNSIRNFCFFWLSTCIHANTVHFTLIMSKNDNRKIWSRKLSRSGWKFSSENRTILKINIIKASRYRE